MVAILYVGLASFHVAFDKMNPDEGFYASAARSVLQGDLPYKDFGYTQMPLLPYLNGAVMKIIGFGLFEQRALNGVWALLALLLGTRLLYRRMLPQRGILLLALFAVTPAWLYFVHLGKTYGLVSLLVMIAATVAVEWSPGWKKCWILSLLGVLGTGCRLPAAPFFGILWLASWWSDEGLNPRQVVAAVMSLVLTTGILLVPFFVVAPQQAWFWTMDFFRVSVPLRDWYIDVRSLVALGPVLLILLGWVVISGLATRRAWPRDEVAVLLAALVALGANVLTLGAYDEYGIPFLPPIALSLLLLLPRRADGAMSWLPAAAVVGQFVAMPLIYTSGRPEAPKHWTSAWLPDNGIPYSFSLPSEIRQAREALVQALPPGQDFFGSAIILAIEADRPLPRNIRMGPFSATTEFSAAEAARLNLIPYDEVIAKLNDPATSVIGIYWYPKFNFAWSMPSFSSQNQASRDHLADIIRENYLLIASTPDLIVFRRR